MKDAVFDLGPAPGNGEALPGFERKFAQSGSPVQVDGGSVISGYASLFGAQDQGGDVVAAGAYAASLAKARAAGRSIKMLWQHDPAQPIGIWDEIREDSKGLFVQGRLLGGVAKAREAAELLAAGAIDGLSIGYRTVRASKTAQGQRLLTELDLWEVSLVTFPMLPAARVAGKSQTPGDTALCEALRGFAAGLHAARGMMRRSESHPAASAAARDQFTTFQPRG
ncbi:MAG: HK97 family phage prohead protease [Sulfitobacter sp.]